MKKFKLIIRFIDYAEWRLADTLETRAGRVFLSRTSHLKTAEVADPSRQRKEASIEDALCMLCHALKNTKAYEGEFPELWPKLLLARIERDARTIAKLRKWGQKGIGAAVKLAQRKSFNESLGPGPGRD